MRSGRYAWVVVGLLWVVALLNYVDRQVLFSLFPLLQSELQLDSVQLGLLSTVFLWVYGLLSPAAGFLADRFGRVRIILVSLLVWSVVTWATGHAHTFGELLAARGLMGISEACYLPAALALVADYHGSRTRSRATGLHQSGLYVGVVLGGVGGGWIGQHYGWRVSFTFLGIVGVAYALLLWQTLRAPETSAGPQRGLRFLPAMRELLGVPGFAAMTLAFAVLSMANWVVYTWLPFYLYERFHLSLTQAGFSATFFVQVAGLLGILCGGWLADRWSRRTVRGRLFTQTAGLLAAGVFLFLAAGAGSLPLALGSLALYGFARSLHDCNAMPVLCQVARPELRSSGYGIFNLAGCLAGGATAAAAGWFKSRVGLEGAFQATSVLVFASAFLLLTIRPRE
jgi:MFS transporter, Spinster family, sphingosine-1-phosphate transporter